MPIRFSPVAGEPQVEKKIVVFGEEGKFGGWSANHGMWIWGDEILVGFSIGSHQDLGDERHNIDREKPEYHVCTRSLDGGELERWSIPTTRGMLVNEGGMRHGTKDPKHASRRLPRSQNQSTLLTPISA